MTTPADGTLRIPTRRRTRVVIVAGLAALGAAAVVWRVRAEPAAADPPPRDRTSSPTTRALTFSGAAEEPEFSRDGRQIAYVERECAPAGARRGACAATLRVMDVRSRRTEVLVRAAEVRDPHWSADGAWIAVLVTPAGGEHAGELGTYVVPRLGGVPRRLAPASLAEFGARGDTLLIATTNASGARFFRRVRAATGEPIDSAALPPSLTGLQGFHPSPDGRWLALRLADRILLATPDRQVTDSLLLRSAGSLRWSPRGDALYAAVPGAGDIALLKRARINPADGRFTGGMETVLDLGTSALPTFDIAPDGHTLVRTGGKTTSTLWALDRDAPQATPRKFDNSTQWLGSPSLSSDGQLVAYEAADKVGLNVYVKPFAGGPRRAITHDSTVWEVRGWVPKTKRLTYATMERPESLYVQEVPDGPRRVYGRMGILLADGGTVALDSTQRRLVFRTAAGAERAVALPALLRPFLELAFADADGGGAYVTTWRAAARTGRHVRWMRVDRASGALGVVIDLAPTQEATFLAADRGEVVYATWPVGSEVGPPTVWRGRAGRPPVKLAELPLDCTAGSLTMSADTRRFVCLAWTIQPDLFLVERFDGRR